MSPRDWPRAIISGAVFGLFAFAYFENAEDEMMKGALIAAFSLAISYWLGSSKGSTDKSIELARHAPEAWPTVPAPSSKKPAPTSNQAGDRHD